MTRTLTPLVTLGLFSALAAFSYGRITTADHPDRGIGYARAERISLDRLIDRINGPGAAAKRHQRLSGTDERAALRYLWGDGE